MVRRQAGLDEAARHVGGGRSSTCWSRTAPPRRGSGRRVTGTAGRATPWTRRRCSSLPAIRTFRRSRGRDGGCARGARARGRRARGGLRARLVPDDGDSEDYHVRLVGGRRCEVIRFTPGHKRLRAVVPEGGLDLPAAARTRLLDAVSGLASEVRIHGESRAVRRPRAKSRRTRVPGCGSSLRARGWRPSWWSSPSRGPGSASSPARAVRRCSPAGTARRYRPGATSRPSAPAPSASSPPARCSHRSPPSRRGCSPTRPVPWSCWSSSTRRTRPACGRRANR